MRICLAVLVAILSAGQTQSPTATSFGAVKGIVVDAHGVGIPDAKVYDEPMGSVRNGKDHFVVTDRDGRFLLQDVPVGKTMVIATKTEAGYPDARFALYSGNEILPIVEVTADTVASDVVVKLLAKGGVLRGRILDSRSKLPVPKARITLSGVDHPEWSLETDPEIDGSFEFIIPARPMHLKVDAEGFRNWTYEGSGLSTNHSPLLIGQEEKRNIEVYLESVK